jgi:hypothetical protein
MARHTIIALLLVLAGCTSHTVDLGGDAGSSGGGSSSSGSFTLDGNSIFIPAVKVAGARALCRNPPPDTPVSGGSPAQMTARLSGVWLLCTYTGSQLGVEATERETRPYAFTSDGSWYALSLDPGGNLIAGDAPGVIDAGIAPYRGTYSYDDANGNPLSGNSDVVWVAMYGSAWFKPSFTTDGTALTMYVVDGSTQTFTRVE